MNKFFERIFNLLFAIFALIITFPLFIIISLLIKLFDKNGPVFFIQKRPGLNGKMFNLYKFRTMYSNNEEILNNYLKNNENARIEWEKYRKLKLNDPRITPIGKFLRKTSLDELPQFINVLKGDMNIVGPRPYIYKEFEEYNIDKKTIDKILSIKPGITGYWQVNGRNDLTFMERIKKDLEYIKNKNFFIDLKIILKTLLIMIKRKGH